MHRVRRRLALAAALAAAAALTGCMPHHRGPSERELALRAARTLGVAPPVVRIYELGAGGMRVQKHEWTEQGRKNVSLALEAALAERGFRLKRVEPEGPTKEELEEVRLLYAAVGSAIIDATYVYFFREKFLNFDYSVGPVAALLQRHKVDALVLAYASDEISSAGRKTLAAITAPFGGMRSGVSVLNVAVVDKTGRVLWFDLDYAEGSYDLRDPDSAAGLVTRLVSRLPQRTEQAP